MASQTDFLNVPGFLEPLDIVRINTLKEVPCNNHAEDVIINHKAILKRGTSRLEAVARFHPAEEHEYIFGNNADCLTEKDMQNFKFNYSLVFVHVQDLAINYQLRDEKNSCRASFIYNIYQYYN